MQDRVRLGTMLLNSDAELTRPIREVTSNGIIHRLARRLRTSLPIALQSESAIAPRGQRYYAIAAKLIIAVEIAVFCTCDRVLLPAILLMSTPQGKGTAIPFPYSSEKAIAKHIT
jgi:hypothetical protein